MKEIRLTKRKRVWVDDDVFDWLYPYNWSTSTTINRFYAVRVVKVDTGNIKVYLHKLITGAPSKFKTVFLDGNTRNCTRQNLVVLNEDKKEICSQSTNTPRFKGVKWSKYYGLWQASIDGVPLGFYPYECDAAIAYNTVIDKSSNSSKNDMSFLKGAYA